MITVVQPIIEPLKNDSYDYDEYGCSVDMLGCMAAP
jgi:hypothetical protein